MKYNIYENGGDVVGSIRINGLVMTGRLKVARTPELSNELANKAYVDSRFGTMDTVGVNAGVFNYLVFPNMHGAVTSIAGQGVMRLADSGVTPGTYNRVKVVDGGIITAGYALRQQDIPSLVWSKVNSALPSTIAGYGITNAAVKTGSTVTGPVIVAQPMQDDEVATKAYVDAELANTSGITVGDVLEYSGKTIDENFYHCNGGFLDKDTDPGLFEVLGYKYTNKLEQSFGRPWNDTISEDPLVTIEGTFTRRADSSTKFGLTSIAVFGDYVYVFGGYATTANGGGYSTVYRALINQDGTLGNFTANVGLPGPRYWSDVLVGNSSVYMTGGVSNETSNTYTNVWRSTVSLDNQLVGFLSNGTIPSTHIRAKSFIIGKRIVSVSGSGKVAWTLNRLGDQSYVWETGPAVPASVSNLDAVCTGKYVYAFGGYEGTSTSANGLPASTSCFRAPVLSNDTLGSWERVTPLPYGIYRPAIAVVGRKVYAIGGSTTVYTGSCTKTMVANILDDGSLSEFVEIPHLGPSRQEMNTFIANNHLFVIGGFDGTNPLGQVWSIPLGTIDPDYFSVAADGKNASWYRSDGAPWKHLRGRNLIPNEVNFSTMARGTDMPRDSACGGSAVIKNWVYSFGGSLNNSTPSTSIYRAPIDADGVIGTWSTYKYSLPTIGRTVSPVIRGDDLYLFTSTPTSEDNAIYRSKIDSDGNIGEMIQVGIMPKSTPDIVSPTRGWPEAFIFGDTIFAYMSGYFFKYEIRPDGTLTPYIARHATTRQQAQASVIKIDDRVLVVGGIKSDGTASNEIVYLDMLPDGIIYHAVATTGLPVGLIKPGLVVTNGYLYVVGGNLTTAGALSNKVYRAPIQANGRLGSFTEMTGVTIPNSSCSYASIVHTSSRLYFLNSKEDVTESGVAYWGTGKTYWVPFAGGFNDYTSQTARPVYAPALQNNKFQLPDLTYLDTPVTKHIIRR